MARRIALRFAFTGFLILTAAAASAQPPGGQQPPPVNPNAIVPGEFVIEPPTLINLGFEWFIEGDDNRNATVEVSYRKKGETAWKQALPLLRLQGERIYSESQRRRRRAEHVRRQHPRPRARHARTRRSSCCPIRTASRGEARKTVHRAHAAGADAVRRRPRLSRLPARLQGSEDRAVVRRADVRLQLLRAPAPTGRRRAGRACGRATRSWCTPGSTSTTATSTRTTPTVNRTVPLDGTYYLTADGTAEMPIAIKAAGDGEAIFDGDGNFALFDVTAADYTYFEGLTFRNTEIAISAGTQFIAGSKGLTVKQ